MHVHGSMIHRYLVSTVSSVDVVRTDRQADELFPDDTGSVKETLWHGLPADEMTGDQSHGVRLSFLEATGWIVGRWPGQKEKAVFLCWLPPARRGRVAVFGCTVAVGARMGAITILDFSAMLAMFEQAEVRPLL
jgi:hypothetical protein